VNLPERIKQLADCRGITMYTIAQETGISQSTLSRLMNNKTDSISRRSLKILADYFQVSLDWLITGEGVPYLDSTTERTKLSARTRIIQYVTSKEIPIKEFAKSIKSSIEYWNDSDNDYTIPIHAINKALKSLPELDPVWVFTGEGEMLKAASSSKIVQIDENPYPVKPFIDSVYAVCGAPSGFSLAIKETECDGLSLPFMNEYDFSIKAKGDSMINRNNPARSIREGDIVACRLWKSRSHVRWGEVYALATSEGVVIKKLQESEKNGFIKCVSFNTEDGFNPYDLPVEEIFDWAIVTGVVSARNWN
jgi:transcriptional regulator with XRE-family HTH domain